MDPFYLIAVILCLIVLAILMVGIGGFAKGGAFNRNHSNRLMRWRIIAQAIAVVAILLLAWARSGGN